MKLIKKAIYVIFTLLIIIHSNVFGQNIESKDSSKIELINAAREIMTASSNCALITLDEEGNSHVRVMNPFLPEGDLTVWFGTNPKSKKVNQINNDSRVTLYYLDKDGSGYVTIHGIAQLVNDKHEKEKRWKDEWQIFYPNRTEGYLLIKVTPQWLEVISYTRGIFGDPITWQAPIVIFDLK